MAKRKKNTVSLDQIEFDFKRPLEKDRNYHLGGKSFYFFDFDDNVAFLATPIIIFNKESGEELVLSSGEFARYSKSIGTSEKYSNYYLDFCDESGSFRNFRDKKIGALDKLKGKKQRFIEDISEALSNKNFNWKAPSWNCFYHATYNRRPISIITARGHEEQTIKDGISLLVKEGHLPNIPNYLSLYPVSHPEVKKKLCPLGKEYSIPDLKKGAIRQSVEKAIQKYGYSDHHRFGMSDDDPHNIELITEEMMTLKRDYPSMSFFVIRTYDDSFSKIEVLQHRTRSIITKKESTTDQMSLFL